jgi:VPS62-like protein
MEGAGVERYHGELMAMPSSDELLEMHKPVLKYDSQEAYFADSAAEWTDTDGNVLRDAQGKQIAVAGAGLGLPLLARTCKDATATAADVLSDPNRDYAEQARVAHENPHFANQVYGRAVVEGNALWLQYWFFYFYNDYNLIGDVLKAGLHECDWEMVQLRLPGGQGRPDLAVYAQHDHADWRDWRQVDLLPGTQRPLVYPARGSHASYFEPGMQWTGYWFDHADGKRRSPELALQVVRDDDDSWLWMRWPGCWGDTKKGDLPIDSDSPRGPGRHAQWDSPSSLLQKPAPALPADAPSPPPAPAVSAEWAGTAIRVHYNARPGSDAKVPSILTVTVNSPDEKTPPVTQTSAIEYASGTVDVATGVDPAHRYDLYVSCASAGDPPLVSPSTRFDLEPAR